MIDIAGALLAAIMGTMLAAAIGLLIVILIGIGRDILAHGPFNNR